MSHKILIMLDDKQYEMLEKLANKGRERVSLCQVASEIVTQKLDEPRSPYVTIDCRNCKDRWCEELAHDGR